MISIYVAVSENNCIGKNNSLPWNQKADLKRLASLTKGHTIVMGRKTYESIIERIGKPLPDRQTIVITRQKDYPLKESVSVAGSVNKALALAPKNEEIFIFGGAEIYNLFLPIADKIYMTKIHTEIDGDTFFPEIDSTWELTSSQDCPKDEKNDFDYSYLIYERRK